MFGKLLGKNKEIDDNKLVNKIDNMNITELKSYVNNKLIDFEVDENGLCEVMKKLLKRDNKTSKRYIEIDDMDIKIKKGFNLVLSILTHRKVTVEAVELVQKFIEMSKDIIENYDKENKDIFASRFNDSLKNAINIINTQAEIQKKMNIIGS